MARKNEAHAFDVGGNRHHGEPRATEGGRCLTRHYSSRKRFKHSCCHAWQGRERAAQVDSAHYNGKCPGPAKNAWDVSGGNFVVNANTPYRHQAHHIIPSGLLWAAAMDAAAKSKHPELCFTLRAGLLDAEYNLNHMLNMIILPMGKDQGTALELPVHTRPARGDPKKNVPQHDEYDAFIKKELQPVINRYMKLLEQAAGTEADHPNPDKLIKAKLVRVSQMMRDKIFRWGRVQPGATLDDRGR